MQNFTLDKGKIVIIIGIIVFILSLFYAISDFQLPSEASEIEPFKPLVELEAVNIDRLAKTHLFGSPPEKLAVPKKAVKQPAAVKKVVKKAPRAKKPIDIKVIVTGLMASNHKDFAAAVLKVGNSPEKMYRIGESLGKPEVTLQKVESNNIVLDNNGTEQIITMSRPGLADASKQDSSRNSNLSQAAGNEQASLPNLEEEFEFLNGFNQENINQPPMPQSVPVYPSADMPPELLNELYEQEAQLNQNQQPSSTDPNTIPPMPETNSNPKFKMPVF